jgi:predicted DNA-binding transcriptional regulator YafY
MKINRLLEITLILLNKKTVTAEEMAERFGVSTRTIYRDIDELSSAGVPVFANQGKGGGISLLENYAINRTILTEHERDSLLLALKTLQATRYPEIDAILEKIGAVFKKAAAQDWVQIEFSPWGSGPNDENKFLNIKKAILECKVVVFDYINADGILSRRQVEPMLLLFKGQAWYFWGWCRMKHDFRTFRVSRIKRLEVTGEAFTHRAPESTPKDEVGPAPAPEKPVTLKLRFKPEDLYRVYDDYDEDRITSNENGTYDVTVTFPEDEWVYGYIQSFGPYVEVLEPPRIRKIIRERLEKTMEYYQR